MRIGAIGAYNFTPYVYNTNNVSSASLNKLSKIPDDVLDRKIDYSRPAEEEENINPLKKGQTLDFQSMLAMQMQRGQNNAARIMRPVREPQMQEDEAAKTQEMAAVRFGQTAQGQETAAAAETEDTASAASDNHYISYQMQQAVNAYGMFMTA